MSVPIIHLQQLHMHDLNRVFHQLRQIKFDNGGLIYSSDNDLNIYETHCRNLSIKMPTSSRLPGVEHIIDL
jgi:hypothetical protein